LFEDYYVSQFELLLKNHQVPLEVGVSTSPIPIHFAFNDGMHVEGSLDPSRVALMRQLFDLPNLAVMDDAIANGTYVVPRAATRRCRFLPRRASIIRCIACAIIPAAIRLFPEFRDLHQLPVLRR